MTSTLKILVNGGSLATVSLTESTAEGSVFEVEVPSQDLQTEMPNVVMAQFALSEPGQAPVGPISPGGAERDSLAGRIDGATMIHYELAEPAGSLAAYPDSLLKMDDGGRVRLALIVPTRPSSVELDAVLRLAADVGRRTRERRLLFEMVSSNQETWLRAADMPAILVGRLDQLVALRTLLISDGFVSVPGGWRAPGSSRPIAYDDGLLLGLNSPWGNHAPVLVATSESDQGLAKAVAALVMAPASGLSSAFQLIDQPPSPTAVRSGSRVSLLPHDQVLEGVGEHVIAATVPVEAVDSSGDGYLGLDVQIPKQASGSPTFIIASVEGQSVGSTALGPGYQGRVGFQVAGGVPRAGLDIDHHLDKPSWRSIRCNDRRQLNAVSSPWTGWGERAPVVALPFF
jgi:hypothetical protein